MTYELDRVTPNQTNRVLMVHRTAGGKGVNTSRILHSFGRETIATGFAGGPNGMRGLAALQAAGVSCRFIKTTNESRQTVTLWARQGGSTVLTEPGPTITCDEWQRLTEMFARLAADADVVVMAGSLPPGLPATAYGELVKLAHDANARTIVDTGGEPLRLAASANSDVVKANGDEAYSATGSHDPAESIGTLIRLGAGSVVLTRGIEGLLAATPDGDWAVQQVDVIDGNSTGAGDAATAAIAIGLCEIETWDRILPNAAAMAAASVASPIGGALDHAVYDRLRDTTVAERIEIAGKDE